MNSQMGKSGRALWRQIASLMGIIDPKVAPGVFKTDEVIPVIGPLVDVGWAKYQIVKAAWESIIPADTTQFTWWLTDGFNEQAAWISTGAGEGSAVLESDNTDYEIALLGWYLDVYWNKGSGTGDDGAWVNTGVRHQLIKGGSDIYLSSWQEHATRETSTDQVYHLQFGGPVVQNPLSALYSVSTVAKPFIWIPAGVQCGIFVDRKTGVWPNDLASAGTDYVTVTAQAWGVKTPKGVRPPLL